jgi:hypothetical protein
MPARFTVQGAFLSGPICLSEPIGKAGLMLPVAGEPAA